MAAKHLGLHIVPVDTQEFATDSDELAVLVADNRLAELSVIDNVELGKLVGELKSDGLDAMLAGFSDDDLAALLADEDASAESEGDGDAAASEDFNISVGEYRVRIGKAQFAAWLL